MIELFVAKLVDLTPDIFAIKRGTKTAAGSFSFPARAKAITCSMPSSQKTERPPRKEADCSSDEESSSDSPCSRGVPDGVDHFVQVDVEEAVKTAAACASASDAEHLQKIQSGFTSMNEGLQGLESNNGIKPPPDAKFGQRFAKLIEVCPKPVAEALASMKCKFLEMWRSFTEWVNKHKKAVSALAGLVAAVLGAATAVAVIFGAPIVVPIVLGVSTGVAAGVAVYYGVKHYQERQAEKRAITEGPANDA